jgi:maleamate amidohydrolase
MSGEWRRSIPEADWQLYEKAGFGRSSGFGASPAIVVIDVQCRTVGDEPAPILESIDRFYRTSCGDRGWRAVERIAELIPAARAASVPVIYPYVAPKTALDAGQTGSKIPSLLTVPDRGYAFVEAVEPQADDLLIPKRHASAFFGTALMSYLVDLRVDTLIVTGCTTSGCVRATVADACSYNLRVVVAEDAVYDRCQLTHDVNLFDIESKYADVLPTDECVAYLDQLREGAGAEAAGASLGR